MVTVLGVLAVTLSSKTSGAELNDNRLMKDKKEDRRGGCGACRELTLLL